jgi:pimeloyl-ACP methyl ester carboxylesterase
MATALTWPERVRGLVVVDIAPQDYPGHDHLQTFAAMLGIDTAALGSRSDAEVPLQHALPEGEGGGDSPADRAMRGFLLQNLVPADRGYRWRVNLPVLAAAHGPLTGWPSSLDRQMYEGPCLSIAGERSNYVGAEGRELLTSYFPNATFSRLSGAGHWPHAEAPAPFMQALRPFLDAHAS